MEIEKRTVKSSPFVGIFSVVTGKVALLPTGMEKTEARGLEKLLGVKIINTSIANSPLLGVFAVGLGKKFLLPSSVEEEEKRFLESQGLETMVMDTNAIGNLVAVNENGGVASTLIKKETVAKIGGFFGIEMQQIDVAGTELPGSALVVTNKGFIVHPNVGEEEFMKLKEIFGANGKPTTANYGDPFIGNGVIANYNAAIVGSFTSGPEIMRIDEGLRGE